MKKVVARYKIGDVVLCKVNKKTSSIVCRTAYDVSKSPASKFTIIGYHDTDYLVEVKSDIIGSFKIESWHLSDFHVPKKYKGKRAFFVEEKAIAPSKVITICANCKEYNSNMLERIDA